MWRIKNIIAYVVLLGIVFSAYVYFCNYYLFLFFLFLLCFLPASAFMMYYAAKRITVELMQRTFQAGKNIEQKLQFQLENKSFLPILYAKLQIEINHLFYEKETVELQSNIPAKSKETLWVPVTFSKSGCIEMKISKIIIRDWLHIFQKEILIGCKEEFMVMPAVAELPEMENLYSDNGAEENNQTGAKGISDTIAAIRDYVEGDRMQQIHWKLSAKKDEILVKEYEHITKENIKIFVELRADEAGELDACLDVAYSMAKLFLRWQQPVTLLWWSMKRQSVQERTIENEDMLEEAMYAVFYEKTYTESIGTCFKTDYFCVQPYHSAQEYMGEKITVYDNKAVVTMVRI